MSDEMRKEMETWYQEGIELGKSKGLKSERKMQNGTRLYL